LQSLNYLQQAHKELIRLDGWNEILARILTLVQCSEQKHQACRLQDIVFE